MSVSILAVLIATIVRFILGSLWYGPLFGKQWMKEIGADPHGPMTGLAKLLVAMFILSLLSSYVLGMFLGTTLPFWGDVFASLSIGAVWVGGSIAMNYMFAKRSMKLFLIDAGFHTVAFGLMGIVFGLLQ